MSKTLRTFDSDPLRADAATTTHDLLVHGSFGIDPATIADMNDLQLMRAADACRFLLNNLPPSTLHG